MLWVMESSPRAGLFVNMLVWPGLGTALGGAPTLGLMQALLYLALAAVFVLGAVFGDAVEYRTLRAASTAMLPLLMATWVWGVYASFAQIRTQGEGPPPTPKRRRARKAVPTIA